MNILRKYLFHVQNSVFEGELTPYKFSELEDKLANVISNKDTVKFYFTYNNKQLYSKSIGITKNISNIIV